MKNKKNILIILLVIIIIAAIITFVLVRKGKDTDNNKIQEYTYQYSAYNNILCHSESPPFKYI